MPDGSWMGDCQESHPHEEAVAENHDHSECSDGACPMPNATSEDHPHEEGVADDHQDAETQSHDDSNEPPHRH